MKRYSLALLAVLLVAQACLADKVVTTEGRTLVGRIKTVAPNGDVHIQLRYGMVVVPKIRVQSVARSDTAGPEQEVDNRTRAPDHCPGGPAYYLLPIVGEIGVEVQAEFLEKALALARNRRHILVLCIDSPGGSVAETQEIVSVLYKTRGIRTVAYVRRALSAAAVIAMACPEICMAPVGTIGGVVPFEVGPNGLPKEVQEKFQSAIRAQFRLATELGHHNPLLLEGMMDSNLELSIRTEEGKAQVVRGRAGTLLKPKGKILTLTAQEAVACGLAKGTAEEPAEAYQALGLDQWHRAMWGGWLQMTLAGKKARSQQQERQKEAYRKKVSPELAKIEKEMSKVQASLKAASATRAAMVRQYEAEVAAVKAEYEDTIERARDKTVSDPRYAEQLRRQATHTRHSKLQSLLSRYHSQLLRLADKINSLKAEYGRLVELHKKLLQGGAE